MKEKARGKGDHRRPRSLSMIDAADFVAVVVVVDDGIAAATAAAAAVETVVAEKS